MGRPKKDPNDVASIKTDVRFTPGEKSALDRVLAERKARGLPGSEHVAAWLRFHLQQDVDAFGMVIERPTPAQRSLFTDAPAAPAAPSTSAPAAPSTSAPTAPLDASATKAPASPPAAPLDAGSAVQLAPVPKPAATKAKGKSTATKAPASPSAKRPNAAKATKAPAAKHTGKTSKASAKKRAR